MSGEHKICPHCEKPAEVYSRITGYYRPVQNWNEGKTQEYKNRINYNPQGLPKKKAAAEEKTEKILTKKTEIPTGAYLFTTKTCPNCRTAKEFLENVEYETVDAEENAELAQTLGIMQAPTLVVVKEGLIHKITSASDIRKYAERAGQ